MTDTVVVNTRDPDGYDVYVGRAFRMYAKQGPRNPWPGYFGNPYKADDYDDCIKEFKRYFLKRVKEDAEFRARALSLKGKRLACFCAPDMCHADVIAEWVDNQE